MIIRRSQDRGQARFGWLDSRHTFSFGHYYDSRHMGFGNLRVINQDVVTPGAGFDTHGHRDMEILSFVVRGGLEHKDSIGTGSVIVPGDIQRMTAGTGIMHSEFNHSREEPVEFLQVWIEPETRGLTPGYEQKSFEDVFRERSLPLVVSRDGREGSLTIHQDVNIYAGRIHEPEFRLGLGVGRQAWVQVIDGSLSLKGQTLQAGDGAALTDTQQLHFREAEGAQLLVFDLKAA